MPYVKQEWVDGSTGETPISSARLNHMEDGIANAVTVAALAPSAKLPPRRAVSMLLDLGVTGHGAIASSGAATYLADDTSSYARGTQSAMVTTKADGTSIAGVRKTGMTPMNLTGKKFEVSVQVSDWSKLKLVNFYLATGIFSAFNVYAMYDRNDRGTSFNRPAENGEWVTFTVDPSSLIQTQGTVDMTAVTALQVGFQDDGTGPVTCRVGHIASFEGSTLYPNGVVSLSFDDSFLSQYTVARPRLERYGFQGTFYTIVEAVDTGGCMTLDQLRTMQRVGGHEIGAHAFTYAAHNATGGFTALTSEQLHVELAGMKEWMLRYGFRGADHLAYPQGIYSAAVEEVACQYFASNRGTLRKPIATPNPAHVLRLNSSGYATPFQTLTQAQAQIDAAYANGSWQIMHFHDFVTAPPEPPGTTKVQWDIASWNSLVDYIAAKGIPVRTVGDVLATVA